MDLSVVVPTLNARERIESTLDALFDSAPDAEVVVVNGPSADGTSGMVREHRAADRLLELSERNLNAARNAGIAAASGDVVAFVGQDTKIEPTWIGAIESAIDDGADAVTGPVHRRVNGGVTTQSLETEDIAGRSVRYFDGGNVAITRATLEALDGFDEYLHTGGARDAAHRLAALNRHVVWEADAVALREAEDDIFHRVGDDDRSTVEGLKYRSLAYRLVKNYGLGVGVVYRLFRHLVGEGARETWDVVRGNRKLSTWVGTGRSVVTNSVIGVQDGTVARMTDRTPRRNPNGVSATMNRPVATYEL
ncbi:MAG: glycosyltransferase family 2 protein [Halodesulfurarchaeum sp.]